MSTCKTHQNHEHVHSATCGHKAIQHDGHTCYLHDGHLHHVHGDHHDEHVLAIGGSNAADCTPAHTCAVHAGGHVHGQGCGHDALPHGDHVCYVVGDHLHHPHGAHCDDHGRLPH